MATFKFFTLTLTVCLWVSVAQAQQSTPQEIPGILLEQQRQSGEKQKRLEQLTTPPAPPVIDKPAPQPAPQGSEATVTVTQFKFSGNTVIETKTLEEIVSPSLGRTLTVRQLNAVAALVTRHYASKGYILSRAYLPPQEIRGGVIQIAVLEGKIGTITVTGNTRYKSSTILRAMTPVRRERVINEGTLETALNEVNDYPGLRVRADLAPGASAGLTNLILSAKERLPYTFVTDINNYGSRLTGPWLYSGEIGLGNPLGLGDNLTLKGTKSDDNLFFTTVSYLVPVTSFGTKVQLSWTHSENVIGEEQAFSLVRPVGRADIASLDVLQTLTRAGALSLLADGGFDFKTIRNIFTIGNPANLQSKDELRVFRLGLRGDYRDQFLGRTYFGLTWHRGVDFWGGSNQDAPQTSFSGAGPGNWSKATAELARFQSLGFPFLRDLPVLSQVFTDSYLILRATGQLASDRLLSPERFAIGGYYSVRGYPVSERIGDNGYAASAEMVVPLPSTEKVPFTNLTWKELIQVAAFIDHGGTFATPITTAQGGFGYLTGAGGGLRINLPLGLPEPADRGTLSLKIDWASAIGRPRPTSRDQGISLDHVFGDGAAGVLYVSASLRL
jgi:hemolysin activation/secretion protein